METVPPFGPTAGGVGTMLCMLVVPTAALIQSIHRSLAGYLWNVPPKDARLILGSRGPVGCISLVPLGS